MSKVLKISVSHVVIPAALATLAFASGCTMQNPDTNIDDLEPNLIPGL